MKRIEKKNCKNKGKQILFNPSVDGLLIHGSLIEEKLLTIWDQVAVNVVQSILLLLGSPEQRHKSL